jgi:hypothetical protein
MEQMHSTIFLPNMMLKREHPLCSQSLFSAQLATVRRLWERLAEEHQASICQKPFMGFMQTREQHAMTAILVRQQNAIAA